MANAATPNYLFWYEEHGKSLLILFSNVLHFLLTVSGIPKANGNKLKKSNYFEKIIGGLKLWKPFFFCQDYFINSHKAFIDLSMKVIDLSSKVIRTRERNIRIAFN